MVGARRHGGLCGSSRSVVTGRRAEGVHVQRRNRGCCAGSRCVGAQRQSRKVGCCAPDQGGSAQRSGPDLPHKWCNVRSAVKTQGNACSRGLDYKSANIGRPGPNPAVFRPVPGSQNAPEAPTRSVSGKPSREPTTRRGPERDGPSPARAREFCCAAGRRSPGPSGMEKHDRRLIKGQRRCS